MKHLILYCFLILAVLTSCDSEINEPNTMPAQPSETGDTVHEKPTPFKMPMWSDSQLMVKDGMKSFSHVFLKKIVEGNNDNVIISPYGVHIGLSMIANAADEKAKTEILHVINGRDIQSINDFYRTFVSLMINADNQVKFIAANSLWTIPGLTPQQSFIEVMYNTYHADLFSEQINSAMAMQKINDWCSDATNQMIQEFLKHPLDSTTVAALFNALYFNGKWTTVFDPTCNTDEKFYGKTSEQQVEMMHASRDMNCQQTEDGIELSLPYGNGTFAINIFLPNENLTIEEYLNRRNNLSTVMVSRNARLSLPKFSLGYDNDDLASVLKSIGIRHIFESLSSMPLLSDGIALNTVQQSTKLKLDESGAEAAGVTGFYSQTASGDMPETLPTLDININRPFIFSITAYSDIILFSGVIREI